MDNHLSWEHKMSLCLSLKNSICLWMRRVAQRKMWDPMSSFGEDFGAHWVPHLPLTLELSKEEARIARR